MHRVVIGSLVVASLVAGNGAFANETAQSNKELLRRLAALENSNAKLENSNAKLKKENAFLTSRVRNRQNGNQIALTESNRRSVPISTAASAALSATAAYASAPAPVFNWTGFYVGVQSGYGWARLNPLDGAPSPSGWFGGGQLGFNYQAAPSFVVGAEVDAAFASLKDTTISVDQPSNLANTVATAGTIDFLGSIRARAGYAADRLFIYGTGGIALAHGQFSSVMNGAPVAQVGTDKHTHAGWVAGAGVESALVGNWTAKLEYLYYQFGNETYVAPGPTIVKFDVQTVKVGVNYLFH